MTQFDRPCYRLGNPPVKQYPGDSHADKNAKEQQQPPQY
jgi:hypothetical protein